MAVKTGALTLTYDFDRIWTRQPCDTEKAWAAFLDYRDMIRPRTLVALAEASGRAPGVLSGWAVDNAWHVRVAAYDRMLDGARAESAVAHYQKSGVEVAGHQLKLLAEARGAAASVVAQWMSRLERGETLAGWSPNDVRGMLKDTIMLERLIRGEATENIAVRASVDLSGFSAVELEEWRRLKIKAGETSE